jgi:hypothetical protein
MRIALAAWIRGAPFDSPAGACGVGEGFDCEELVFVAFDGVVFERIGEVEGLEVDVPVFDEDFEDDAGDFEVCGVAAATDATAANEAIKTLINKGRGMGYLLMK